MNTVWTHVLVLGALAVFLRFVDPRSALARAVALGCLQVYVLRYYAWRATETLPPVEGSAANLWQLSFFGIESLSTLFLCWTALILTRQRDNRRLADIREGDLRGKPLPPKVTVLIPTYHEPIEVLEPTILAAVNIDYPNFEVVVLDDDKGPAAGRRRPGWMMTIRSLTMRTREGGRRKPRKRPVAQSEPGTQTPRAHAWLEALCVSYGVKYLRRDSIAGAKAGNLNHGLANTDGEVILVLDADFLAMPNILWRTVGLLDDETALVQTPQHYYSSDPIQRNLGGGKAWTEEQRFFFDKAIPSRDAWGNAICVGTGFVVRRAALGPDGFETGCLSEDVYGGYALVSRGWQIRYLNEVLSHGAAADSLVEYIRQRTRWCQGIIQAIWLPYGPLRAPRLRLVDRLLYLEMPLYWVSQYGLLAMIVLAPAVYFWTGVPVFRSPFDEATGYVVPRIVASALVTYWISEGKVMPIVTDVTKLVAVVYIIAAMLSLIFNPRGKPFDPTNKGQAREDVIVNWDIMWPFLVTALIVAAGLLRNLLSDAGPVEWNEFLAANVLIGFYSLTLLSLTCLACVDWPKAALAFDYDQPQQGRWLCALSILFGPWRRKP
jgi:cellulose synthase (UDP-forming)